MAGAVLLAAALLVGCGGSGDAGEDGTAQGQERIYPNVTGPTREFLVPDGDNIVQFYGREATPVEREEASRLLHGWLRARENENWPKDCSYFHRWYRESLVKDAHGVTSGKVKNCPQALAYFGHEASGDYVDNLPGPIVSLRVRGGQGYAQYHGTDGRDWIVPMNKEDGKWKVANATPIDRLK